jgi:hypothetical protein
MDFRARFYSGRLGRFVSPDTIVPGVGSASLNRYMYGFGNPLKFWDPSGHYPQFAFGGGGGRDPVEAFLWGQYRRGWSDVCSYIQFRGAFRAGLEAAAAGNSAGERTELLVESMAQSLGADGSWGLKVPLRAWLDPRFGYASAQESGQTATQLVATLALFAPNLDTHWRMSPETWVTIPNETYPTQLARNTIARLEDAATTANSSVPGRGPVVGTRRHTIFQRTVAGWGDRTLRTEVSYRLGWEVSRGKPGSVRLDVVEFDSRGNIIAVYDYKTGNATLSATRVTQIRSHLPPYAQNVPIIEIRGQ